MSDQDNVPDWEVEQEYIEEETVILNGGVELTPYECKEALDEAMKVIECVGTTGIYSQYQRAFAWMKRYYPNWS